MAFSFPGCAVVWLAVMCAMLGGGLRRPPGRRAIPDAPASTARRLGTIADSGMRRETPLLDEVHILGWPMLAVRLPCVY